ncbi:MAG: hypothetical protein HQK77_03590 [Desulfobacterales bacterium]|nr:hypothetical protein [Desulfobacterales bacterium]
MIDIALAYNRYRFLGNEFLTWLWYAIENGPEQLFKDPERFSLTIGNRVVLEHHLNDDSMETVTIKGDDADLKEGLLALSKGAFATEMNLTYKEDELEWRFSIKGESLTITGLKPPETAALESKEDIEGAILEKYYLYNKVFELIDRLFINFVRMRITDMWQSEILKKIKNWISNPTP